MLLFLILVCVPIIVQHVKIKGLNYKKRNKVSLMMFWVFLTILLMSRHPSVGNDTANYCNSFRSIDILDLGRITEFADEYGFVLYTKLISLITDSSQVYIGITALIISILIAPVYIRMCQDASLSIVLFVTMSTFPMMFSGIRQMLAIAMGFVAYEFVRNKKFLAFLVTVFVAISFHISAIMLLVMYPLFHMKITKKTLAIVVPAMGFTFVYNKVIFQYLSRILEQYTRFEAAFIETNSYMMIILFILFGIFSFVVVEEKVLDKETKGLRNFLILSIFLQLFAPLHTVAMRMNYYYIIFIPLLLPNIIKYRNKKWTSVALVARHLMVIFFLIYFFMMLVIQKPLNIVPYKFFWERM